MSTGRSVLLAGESYGVFLVHTLCRQSALHLLVAAAGSAPSMNKNLHTSFSDDGETLQCRASRVWNSENAFKVALC